MFNSLQSLIFLSGMVMGVWISIFNMSWIGVWVGLEMNLLCFIPFLTQSSKNYSEAGVSYFLTQACGSFILLMAGVSMENFSGFMKVCISLALLLKMGVSPFHFWYPWVASELKWEQFFFLSTLQKLAPLILLYSSELESSSSLIYLSIIMSGLVGGVGGINESSIRKLLVYSSINHLGWILIPLVGKNEFWVIYFFIYCFMLLNVVMMLIMHKIYYMNQLCSVMISWKGKLVLMVGLLSLGGMPPLLGFISKWGVISMSVKSIEMVSLTVMVMSSVITLFYYTRAGFSVLILNSANKFFYSVGLSVSIESYSLLVSLIGFWLSPIMVISFLQ
uniref:NADH-ubiquinone oxidoreductase chain 2 n=1 Tax=Cylisticus convexus TaxID=96835 RepID=A0A0G2T5W7_9CRUS|nr:NADH dehydrogenase subunit 2 [Cylisticus convexus]